MTGKLGLFRRIRWGRNVDVLLLDARSFRSPDVRAACPAGAAPTGAHHARREPRHSGIASLANPVAAGCRDAIALPTGAARQAQITALRGALK